MAKKKSVPAEKTVEAVKKVEKTVEKVEKPVNPFDMPDKTKKEGDTGNVVRWIQFQLGIDTSGEFDEKTTEAVKTFQASHEVPETGIVDKLTRGLLTNI